MRVVTKPEHLGLNHLLADELEEIQKNLQSEPADKAVLTTHTNEIVSHLRNTPIEHQTPENLQLLIRYINHMIEKVQEALSKVANKKRTIKARLRLHPRGKNAPTEDEREELRNDINVLNAVEKKYIEWNNLLLHRYIRLHDLLQIKNGLKQRDTPEA